jgi:hypothetical protein
MSMSRLAPQVGGTTATNRERDRDGVAVGKRALTSELPPAPMRREGTAGGAVQGLPRLQLRGIPAATSTGGGEHADGLTAGVRGDAPVMASPAEHAEPADHEEATVQEDGQPAAPPDAVEAQPAEEPDRKIAVGEQRAEDPGEDSEIEGDHADGAAAASTVAAGGPREAADGADGADGAGGADGAEATAAAEAGAAGPGPAETATAGPAEAEPATSGPASTEAAAIVGAGGASAAGDVHAEIAGGVADASAPAVAAPAEGHDAGAASDAGGHALAHVDAALQPQDGGQPLPAALREQMEDRVGVELGDVRLHTGGEPATVLDAMGGKAATKGKHVILGAGVDPGSREGQEIVEHELVHVVQQADGRAGEVGGGAGEAQRAGLEAEAHGHARRGERGERGSALGRMPRRLALPDTGPALFFGIPNPIDVAKDVGGAVIHGAEAAGDALVHQGKKAVHTIKDTAGKVFHSIADGVSKVVGWVAQGVRGIVSAIGKLRDLAARLLELPIIGAILQPIVSGLAAAAEVAGKLYREAKARVRRFIAGARRLYGYARKLISRGPAYFEAGARAAATAVAAGVQGADDLLQRGKRLIDQAAHAVWKEARRQFDRATHDVRIAYRGVKTGITSIGHGLERAGRWIEDHKKKLSNLAHLTLDVAGLLPGVGAVADVANGLLYAAEGNWKQAGLSLVFAIPALGDAAKAGELGVKGAEAAVKMRGAMQKTFKYAHSGLDAARARSRNWRKLLDHVADSQHDRIHRFHRMLGGRFDEIERRYHDFKPRVHAFKKDMEQRLHDYRDRYRAHREELHAKFTEAREMVDLFLKVHSLQSGFNQAIEDWVTGPPPSNPAQPVPATG